MIVTDAGTGGGESATTWDLASITGVTGYKDAGINRVVASDGTEYVPTLTHSASGTTVSVAADLDGVTVALGRAVNAEIELSQVYVRDRQEQPLRDGRTRIKKANIEHRQASAYTAIVSSSQSGAPTRSYTLGPGLGTVEEYGFNHFWIGGAAPETTIQLKSDNAGPCTWTSIEWHGEYDTLTE